MNPFAELRKQCLVNGKPVSMAGLSKEFNYAIKASHICNLENGREEASMRQLKVYHDYFHVSYDYLMGESNKKDMGDILPNMDRLDIPEWLADSKNPDEIMIRQTMEELMGTGKGMVLLSYISELLYTHDSDVTGYYMEGTKLQRMEPYDEALELKLLSERIKAYKKMSDKARFIEVRELMENIRDNWEK